MPQRQQMPFYWGRPPGQMGQFQRPSVYPRMNRQMYPMGQMGPIRQMRPSQARQGGGILARLLGKGKGKGARGGFLGMNPVSGGGAAPGGSFFKSFTNPTAISGFLNNTQQVLRAAQQIGPMVSQYGPLVRNLPAMWRLYRGLKDGTVENAENQEEQSDVSVDEDERLSTKKKNKTPENGAEKQTHRSKVTNETENRKYKDKITDNSPGKLGNKKSLVSANESDWDDESDDKPVQRGTSIPRLYI